MTPTQKRVLDFVAETIKRTGGIAPTYREISAGARISSIGSVKLIIDRLEKDGHIIRKPHRARSLEVVTGTCPHCHTRLQ